MFGRVMNTAVLGKAVILVAVGAGAGGGAFAGLTLGGVAGELGGDGMTFAVGCAVLGGLLVGGACVAGRRGD